MRAGTELNKPRWQTRRVTIKDIASAAGVDPSTVTRALQGSSRVKKATRERIAELARGAVASFVAGVS